MSTLTETFYREHLLPLGQPILDTTTWMKISAANGTNIPYVGYIELDVVLLGQQIPKVGFLVVKGSSNPDDFTEKQRRPGIIGCNVLQRLHQKLNEEYGVIDYNSIPASWQDVLRLFDEYQSPGGSPEVSDTAEDGRLGSVRVAGRRPVKIPAWSVKVISGTTRVLNGDYCALVEQDKDFYSNLPNNVMLIRSYSPVQKGSVSVCLLNYGDEDVWLQPRLKLANVYQVEEIAMIGGDYMYQTDDHELVVTLEKMEASEPCEDTGWKSAEELIEALDVDTSQFTPDQLRKLKEMLLKHQKVFSRGDHDLGYTDKVKHRIETTDDTPIRLPHRRLSPHLQPAVRDHLERMLKNGIIRESNSPFASQAVVIEKKDKTLRICVDYRLLNKKTIKDAFPLPRIDESLDSLHGAKLFSSIDLAQGYLQCAMDERDMHKTAFRAGSSGLYEFTRLPFGLCNAPATFSRLMMAILGDQNFHTLLLYLDDILVFAENHDQMLERLDLVFTRLELHGLKIKPSKTHLFKPSVKYLGHVVQEDGVSPDPGNIDSVKNWPQPQSASKLKSFMGLASYYRKFVKGFAQIAAPLNELLNVSNGKKRRKSKKADVGQDTRPFLERWTPKCTEAFEELKQCLISPPVLGYPDFSRPFLLETDAAATGLGAVLSQQQGDQTVVIAYASRNLRASEKNYAAIKLEFLAIKWSICEKFRDYLIGGAFTVLTDNNPLSYLETCKLSAADLRWVSELSSFNFKIKYRPGKKNQAADALSRNPREVFASVLQGSVLPTQLRVRLQQEVMLHEQQMNVKILASTCAENGVPTTSMQEMSKLQMEDAIWSRVHVWFKRKVMPKRKELGEESVEVRRAVKHISKIWHQLQLVDGVLYRVTRQEGIEVKQLLLPHSLTDTVLKGLHDKAGHQGVERTLALVRMRCFWIGLREDVEKYVKNCERCMLAKEHFPKVKPKFASLLAKRPLEILAIDFLKLDKASDGRENVLTMTDVFSKFAKAVVTRNQKASTVAKTLVQEWFVNFGVPRRIHSDQGSQFEGKVIEELCRMYNIEKTSTAAYSPNQNGQCERYNRTLINLLRTLPADQKKKWPNHIGELVFAYNATPHSTTGLSPHYLLFGVEPRLPVDNQLLVDKQDDVDVDLEEWLRGHQTRMSKTLERAGSRLEKEALIRQRFTNKKRSDSVIPIGGRVFLRDFGHQQRAKLQDVWNPIPHKVLDRNGNIYKVQPADGYGAIKERSRKDLLDTRELVQDFPSTEDKPEEETEDKRSVKSESSDELELEVRDLPVSDQVDQASSDSSDSDVQEEVPVRRSKRSTAGKHPNPLRLPRSVLQKQDVSFDQFTQAISNLGTSLAQVVQDTYLKQKIED